MNSYSIRSRVLPAASILIAVVAVIAIVASGALAGGNSGPGAQPSSSPSNPPTSAPSPAPTPTADPTAAPTPQPAATPKPEPTPSPEPSDEPADGIFEIELNTPDNHDVTITVDDATGSLVGAASGNPGHGMSVRWFDLKVENEDPNTLRLTWVGLPYDQDIELFVAMRDDGNLRLRMVQPGPPANSDAMGFDRTLILTFDRPISADDVLPTIQESLDTAD